MRSLGRVLILCLSVALCAAEAGSLPAATPPGASSSSANAALRAAPDSALMAAAVNAFGLDLYRNLAAAHPREAIFFSPYSILTALGMAAEGARGRTAAEMYAVLHLPAEEVVRHAGLVASKRRFGALADTTAARRTDAALDSLRAVASQFRRRVKVVRDSMFTPVDGARDHEAFQRLLAESERLPGMQDDVAARIGELLGRRGPAALSVANVLWVERTFPLAEPYLRAIDLCYEPGSARPANFIGDPGAERLRINRWAEQVTHARIKDLLPEGEITELTRIVLANAMYFRGEWRNQFRRSDTKEADFSLAAGKTVKVSMMGPYPGDVHYAAFHVDGSLFDTPANVRRGEDTARCYPDSSGFAMVEIPYREERLSMVVIAPNRPDGLEAIEEMCDAETLARWIQAGRKRPVELYLPNFRSETRYNLNETLASMGMRSAFRSPGMPGGADFSGMAGSQEPNSQLFISLVAHRAFIQVNEEGTEAAAATAVEMECLGSATDVGEMIPFIPVFRADRPFLYLIRDTRTGVVLFLGRVMNPA